MDAIENGGTPGKVLVRDLIIFQIKTVLDGLKDAVVIPASIVAVVLDLVAGGSKRGRLFYSLLAACESFDRWLNLNGAAHAAMHGREGLFGGSEPGDGTMVGDLEGMVVRERAARG